MRKIKIILASLLITFLSIFLIALFFHNHTKERHKKLSISTNADIRLEKIYLSSTNEGNKEWELKADLAQYFRQKNIAKFENVRLVFYSKDGRTYRLQGDQATVKTDTQDIKITGNIQVFTDDGYKLYTNSLTYHPKTKEIYAISPVKLVGDRIEIRGKSMKIDLKTGKMFLSKDVTTKLKGRLF